MEKDVEEKTTNDDEEESNDEEEEIDNDELSIESDEETEEEEKEDIDNDKQVSAKEEKKKQMKVKVGEITKENPWEEAQRQKQEYRLREKMVKKKHRNLYKSMMKGREERRKAIWLLRKKRRIHDANKKREAKGNAVERKEIKSK